MRRLAAGLLGFLLVAGCGGGGPRAISDRVQEYTWMRADGEFTATTELFAAHGALWAAAAYPAEVVRFDPSTGETTPILPNDEDTVPTAAAVGAGAVWLGLAELGGDGHDFLRVDVDTGMAAQLDVSGRIEAVAVEGDDVWALVDSDAGDLAVVHLDPDSGAELERVPVTSGHDLVVLGGEPWFASGDAVRRVPVIVASG